MDNDKKQKTEDAETAQSPAILIYRDDALENLKSFLHFAETPSVETLN